ncbi:MAG TPA: excalibur calcium-binding domain-containing protein [Jatrophihabitans sp.]|nr:excalibur calcium-binding domain-containing protein [Jatrophihabitans sp.]
MSLFHHARTRHARKRPPGVRRTVLAAAALTVAVSGTYAGRVGADPADPGSIAGTVVTAGDAQAVTAVEVDLYDGTGTVLAGTQPAADGSYSFAGLAPADYTLHFAVTGAQAADYVPEWWDNQPLQQDADPVTVTAGQVTALGEADLDLVPLSPAPTISGTALVGQTLTATAGQWRPVPDSFGYQWLAGGDPIPGATGSSYLLSAQEIGKQITVAVTANRAGVDPITTTSAATAPVTGIFTSAPTPVIIGRLVTGQTLQVVPGSWAPAGATLSFLWYRNGIGLPNTNTTSYLLTNADRGARISVKVTASLAGYLTTSRPSAPTGPVAGLTGPTPRLTGIARYGQLLQVLPGSWLPEPVALRYQWYLDYKPIPGAVAAAYRLPLVSIGHSVWATVTGLRTGYAPLTVRTASVRIAPLSFTSVPTPRVLGTARVGALLVASMPATTPASSIHFQWRLNGVGIPGAIGSAFRVRPTDVDRRFTVVITAVRAGYASVLRGSAYTAPAVGLAYPNCDALNSVYPHGVARNGVAYDLVSGRYLPVSGPPFFSTSLYNLNPDRDRDKDGIACEQR